MQDFLTRNYNYLDRMYRVFIFIYYLSNLKLSNQSPNLSRTPTPGFVLYSKMRPRCTVLFSSPGGIEKQTNKKTKKRPNKYSLFMITGGDHGGQGPPDTQDTRGPDTIILMFPVCGRGWGWAPSEKKQCWLSSGRMNRFILPEVLEGRVVTAQLPTSQTHREASARQPGLQRLITTCS